MNVAQGLERSARHFADRTAIVAGDRALTYRELEAAVSRAAHALRALGVRQGDRVALYLPNVPEFAVAYLAALKLGAIAVSVNVMLVTEEVRYVVSDSGAKVLFTTGALLPRVEPLLGSVPSLEHVVLCEGERAGDPAHVHALAELAAAAPPDPVRAVDLDRDAPAAILYTSGTTGKQKGATLSHGNVVSNATSTRHCVRLEPSDRLLLFLPLFHCFGQNFILNAGLAAGATIVLHRRFELEPVVASVERHGVTCFYAVPTIYIHLLAAGIAKERLATVRFWFSAAAPLPAEVAGRWREAHGRPIHEGYGLTETSPSACFNHEIEHRIGTVGSPIENVEMKVFDDEDREVPAGTRGEIVVRGPNVMLGYWNRPEDTARALRGGWFHTGDIGFVDEDGYFHVVDRQKDMINSAGFKVWPVDVEQVLYEHPAVKECAVIGAPDPVNGEVVAAFVTLQDGARLGEDELKAFCRARMAAYKVPRKVFFAGDLPKSATGKLLKRVLRERIPPP
jgi:long-chain acyl-CoA synthetase